jgi:hypothetical protein
VRCLTCSRMCDCPKHLHTGEAKVIVPLSAHDLEHLLGQEPGSHRDSVYDLYRRLEVALELLQGTK